MNESKGEGAAPASRKEGEHATTETAMVAAARPMSHFAHEDCSGKEGLSVKGGEDEL